MSGYESYSQEELNKIISSFESNLRGERFAAERTGLRAEIARANVREFEKQLRVLRFLVKNHQP